MEQKAYYSIGEVSKICHISKKALRFYDEIGLISPSKVDENQYRYYTHGQLLLVPVIKYYKQMGFKLEEIRAFLSGSSYERLTRQFMEKIAELHRQENEIHRRTTCIKDWYNLILEAESVIASNACEVAVKYMEPAEYCFLEQSYTHQLMETIINIDFTNYIEAIGQETTGAIVLCFPHFQERLLSGATTVKIMQQVLLPAKDVEQCSFGGHLVASCYHIGTHSSIAATYQKICTYLTEHRYQWAEAAYERYVTDYWTTRNPGQFVTEIILPIYRP